MMGERAKDVEVEVMDQRLGAIAQDVSEIKTEMRAIKLGMERLARLEERHVNSTEAIARAFTRIESHEHRLVKIEVEMPLTKLARSWVIAGVIGLVGIIGMQAVSITVFLGRDRMEQLRSPNGQYGRPALPAKESGS